MNPIKIFILVIIFLGVIFYIQSIVNPDSQQKLLNLLSEYIAPNLPFYSFITEDVAEGTLAGVAAFTAFANIPFIPNPPIEPYIIYVSTKGTNSILLVLTVSIITTLSSSIMYFVGYIFGPKAVEKITKKGVTYNRIIDTLVIPITFLTHFLPLPIPNVFPFVFGAYKSNFRYFMMAAFLGILIKIILILLLFNRYSDLIPQLPGFIGNIF